MAFRVAAAGMERLEGELKKSARQVTGAETKSGRLNRTQTQQG